MKTLFHWFFVAKSERTSDVGVHAETYRRFVNDTPYYDALVLMLFVFCAKTTESQACKLAS